MENNKKNQDVITGLLYIIIGVILSPIFIGIPLVLIGLFYLAKA